MTDFTRLEQNLIDVIKEEQAKLGYQREEIRLYYPLGSLNHLLGTEDTAEGMKERLKGSFAEFTKDRLGKVRISNQGERFCFRIPEEGSSYVKEHTEPGELLQELVEQLRRHDCSMEEIRAVFSRTGRPFQTESVKNGEFDWLLRFTDGTDPYLYCFKEEGCHLTYHRFLPEDYEEFGF